MTDGTSCGFPILRGSDRYGGGRCRRGEAAEQLNRNFARDLAQPAGRMPAAQRPCYLFIWGGGVNVAGGNPTPNVPDNTAFEMSLEAILQADPDVIFVYDDSPARAFETNPI